MANRYYGFTGLTGGAAGDLDAIDGSLLSNEDMAHGIVSGVEYFYYLSSASGATASSPSVISPVSNAGTKRWILSSKGYLITDTGGADAYEIPVNAVTGVPIFFKAITANTGASTLVTLNLTAKAIKKNVSDALVAGDISANQIIAVVYDGTNFQLLTKVQTDALIEDTGAADAYDIPVYAHIGVPIYFKASAANTGASTLTTTNLTTKAIKKDVTTALAAGDIAASQIIGVVYDGTNFQLLGSPGGTMLQREFFGSSDVWVVPAKVSAIWVSGCAGGGGGQGRSGGGDGGGGGGSGSLRLPFSVTPGETITITIGAAGAGRTVAVAPTDGGDTVIVGSFGTFTMPGGKTPASAGGPGGDGGYNPGSGAASKVADGLDCYETSFRVCGAGGGGGGGGEGVAGSKGGRSGWGAGMPFGSGGGGGSSPFGFSAVGANSAANSGAGGCGGDWTTNIDGKNGGSGRVIFEYWA